MSKDRKLYPVTEEYGRAPKGWYPHKGATRSTKPSLTEQSMANETDINIIMKNQNITGFVPGPAKPPVFGDFSELPTDLKGFINMGRSLSVLVNRLPPELRGMKRDELLKLTPEELAKKLEKPADPPAPPKDEPK